MPEERAVVDLDEVLSQKRIQTSNSRVLVMRHAPPEPDLRRGLPWLSASRPEIYNAYQQTQQPKEEKQLSQADYLVSCIGHRPKAALFIGVYNVAGFSAISSRELLLRPEYQELRRLGQKSGSLDRSYLWFDLEIEAAFQEWKGKLVLGWPPMERNWSRWADRNRFPIAAMLERSMLDRSIRSL